eukprot:1139451-Pelagomonas_calceolata.AAC.1
MLSVIRDQRDTHVQPGSTYLNNWLAVWVSLRIRQLIIERRNKEKEAGSKPSPETISERENTKLMPYGGSPIG